MKNVTSPMHQSPFVTSFIMTFYLILFLLGLCTFVYYVIIIILPSYHSSDFYNEKRMSMERHIYFLLNHYHEDEQVYVPMKLKAYLIVKGIASDNQVFQSINFPCFYT
jgi:hypothetical protein